MITTTHNGITLKKNKTNKNSFNHNNIITTLMMTRLKFLSLGFLALGLVPVQSFQPILFDMPHQLRPSIRKLHPLCSSSVAAPDPYLNSEFGWHNASLPETQTKPTEYSAYSPSTCSFQAAKEYSVRIKEWATMYTTVDGLRERFGRNRNRLFGDLDSARARRLYQTLLPTALLPLIKAGVKPEDLAPLAYKARVAAKLYARERSRIPARIAANLFDGFRQLKRYGKFNTRGMTYDQVWEKYKKVILDDCDDDGIIKEGGGGGAGSSCDFLTEEDVTAQICLKILEKSVTTNKYIDRLFSSDQELGEEFSNIIQILENDVRRLVDPVVCVEEPGNKQIRRYRTLRSIAMAKQRIMFLVTVDTKTC